MVITLLTFARYIAVLVLCIASIASVAAHPHISRDDAAAMLDQAQNALAEMLGRHAGAPPPEGHPDAEQWRILSLQRAECWYLLGEYDKALQACNDLAQQWSTWPDVYSLRRVVHLQLGDDAAADADGERYLELGAGDPQLAVALARRPVPEDNPEEARQTRHMQLRLVRTARQRWPQDASLLQQEIRLLSALADHASLHALAQEILQQGSDTQRVAVVQALRQAGQGAAVRDILEQLDPAWLIAPPPQTTLGDRLQLAVEFHHLGLRESARQAAAGALLVITMAHDAIDPDEMLGTYRRLTLRGERARALAVLGRWQEALELVESLLRDDHDHLRWLAARVVCLQALGDDDRAQAAKEQWRDYFAEVGLRPDPDLLQWP
ncbi:MAG: hypothetical protein EA401_05980 [Planctomycetota bacterium]|nr:MAG: hypothetical protein EA401_05980 [Planctomycetota bacterium]